MKTLLIILVSAIPAASQDITISIGTSHYLGDLGGNKGVGRNGLKDFNLKSTGVAFSVGYDVQEKFALSLSYVTLHDNDKYAKLDGDSWYRWIRGYSFKTSIIELSILKSIQLWNLLLLKTGASMFLICSVNRLEQSRFSSLQPAIPLIAELKHGSFGIGINYRKTFTDYIDGYSLRADPTDMDSYFTISLSYTFKKQSNIMKCPKNP